MIMAIEGTKLSDLTNKIETIQGTERIYVSDGTGTPKYIETSQLATQEDLGNIDTILDSINGEVIQ